MIGRIFNWLGGGFFRTIGRFIAFIVLGAVISILLSKSDFKIGSLFGFEYVKADTYVGGFDEVWYEDENLTQQWTNGITYQYKTLQSTTSAWNSMQYFKAYAKNQYSMTAFKGGHITIPFVFDFPLITGTDGQNSNITYYTCKTWTQQTSGSYICTSYDDQSFVIRTTDYEYIPPVIQMNAYIEYTNGYNDNCEINFNTNYISCPVANREDLEIKNFLLVYKFLTTWSGNFKFGLGLKFNGWSNDTNSIINNQNQNSQNIIQSQENQTQSILDTNMTETNSTATSFFDNFSDTDHGGLSSIITAPLTVINSMLSNTCVAPSATWKGATITLPCGNMFWDRPGASDLRNLLNVFYGGFVCYYAIRRLFLLIEGMKDPTHDNIEVAEL